VLLAAQTMSVSITDWFRSVAPEPFESILSATFGTAEKMKTNLAFIADSLSVTPAIVRYSVWKPTEKPSVAGTHGAE
jgi:hypothetical protein